MEEKTLDAEMIESTKLVIQKGANENPFIPMISKAMESEHGLAKLDQLLDLQMKWEENEAKKAFNRAFAAFKAEAIEIIKDKTVDFQAQGGRVSYTHATLGKIIETVIPFLSKHGLSHRWDVKQEGAISTVTCFVTHELGHSAEVSMSAGKDDSGRKNQIQQVASTVTYLQRYTFLAVTGLAAKDQDDDGQRAGMDDETEYISEAQIYDIIAKLAELVGTTDEKMVAKQIRGFCSKKQIKGLEFLPADRYAEAISDIEQKIKEGK